MVQTSTLMQIAGIGGVIVAGTGIILREKLRSQVTQTDMYKSAMKNLRANPGAIEVLGEPIKDKVIKINYDKNYCDGNNAKYQIPISGAKARGIYYIWAKKENDQWKFTRAELGLDTDPDRRLVIIRQTPDFVEVNKPN